MNETLKLYLISLPFFIVFISIYLDYTGQISYLSFLISSLIAVTLLIIVWGITLIEEDKNE